MSRNSQQRGSAVAQAEPGRPGTASRDGGAPENVAAPRPVVGPGPQAVRTESAGTEAAMGAAAMADLWARFKETGDARLREQLILHY